MLVNTKSKIIEKFETVTTLPQHKAKLEEIVLKLYKELYPTKQLPSNKLIAFYVDYAMKNKITESELKKMLLQQLYTIQLVLKLHLGLLACSPTSTPKI